MTTETREEIYDKILHQSIELTNTLADRGILNYHERISAQGVIETLLKKLVDEGVEPSILLNAMDRVILKEK